MNDGHASASNSFSIVVVTTDDYNFYEVWILQSILRMHRHTCMSFGVSECRILNMKYVRFLAVCSLLLNNTENTHSVTFDLLEIFVCCELRIYEAVNTFSGQMFCNKFFVFWRAEGKNARNAVVAVALVLRVHGPAVFFLLSRPCSLHSRIWPTQDFPLLTFFCLQLDTCVPCARNKFPFFDTSEFLLILLQQVRPVALNSNQFIGWRIIIFDQNWAFPFSLVPT